MVPYRRIQSAAYIGAMALTIKSMTPALAHTLQSRPTLPTAIAIGLALANIQREGAKHFTSKTAAEFVTEVRADANQMKIRGAQTEIMEEIHSALAKKELPSQVRARIMSASNEHASIWLTKLPTEPHFQLSGTDLAIAIRHRIGLAPTDHEGVACMGCNKSITDSNHDHYHVCRRLVSATIARHNTVLSAVQTIATTAGSQVQREYRIAAIDYKKKFRIGNNKKPVDLRPDAAIRGIDHNILIDVSITTPTALSYILRENSPTPLFAAKRRETVKRKKYSEIATVEHADFYGVVMESFGAMGNDIHRLLDILNTSHKIAVENSNWNLKRWGYAVLSFALQRGNGRLAFAAFRHDRRSPVRV